MEHIAEAARRRIEDNKSDIFDAYARAQSGLSLAAEIDPERAIRRIQARTGMNLAAAQMAHDGWLRQVEEGGPDGAERIQGATVDFMGVAFLERGFHAARAVGRVAYRDGQAQGSGFLIAPGIFMTNNHVIESPQAARQFVVEFDYELDRHGRPSNVSRFEFEPDALFITDDTNDLDYSILAVGRRLGGDGQLQQYGFCPLSDARDKHTLGEFANVVQHPQGRFKEVVLRENQLVWRLENVLHYVADTEPGSSGSPVFNNEWQVIALHHWGGPWRQRRDDQGVLLPTDVNEGIRISAIVRELRERFAESMGESRDKLSQVLSMGDATGGIPVSSDAEVGGRQQKIRVREDGTVSWELPLEISVGIPSLASMLTNSPVHAGTPSPPLGESFRRTVDTDYENRRGYVEKFIRGHPIPMPELSAGLRQRAARNLQAEAGQDPFEFPYQHFSVFVDGTRRLPLFTACNIDGRTSKNISRRTGDITSAEAIVEEFDPGPEARERWHVDPRIDPNLVTNDRLYRDQVVAAGRNRIGRIFHRGHMVRRLDPAWGRNASALRAEADTFHFTNCVPQIGVFNSRNALWQGIENYVLDNARDHDRRVCVFTGPVFDEADPLYRDHIFPGFRVPMSFWKLVAWRDEFGLGTVCMLADQSASIGEMPEAIEDAAERFDDTAEIEHFVVSIAEVEELTGLRFAQDLHDAELYEFIDAEAVGEGRRKRLSRLGDLTLDRKPKPKARPRSKKGTAK